MKTNGAPTTINGFCKYVHTQTIREIEKTVYIFISSTIFYYCVSIVRDALVYFFLVGWLTKVVWDRFDRWVDISFS
jgi:hypothetical protein